MGETILAKRGRCCVGAYGPALVIDYFNYSHLFVIVLTWDTTLNLTLDPTLDLTSDLTLDPTLDPTLWTSLWTPLRNPATLDFTRDHIFPTQQCSVHSL